MEEKKTVKIRNEGYGVNLMISAFLAAILIFISAIVFFFSKMSFSQNLFVFGILLLIYVILLPLTVRPRKIVLIKMIEEKIREVIVEKPVIKEKIIIRNEEVKKVLPPFVASSKTGRYHKGTCRLSRLIKKDAFEGSKSDSEFKKKKYKKCKICLA